MLAVQLIEQGEGKAITAVKTNAKNCQLSAPRMPVCSIQGPPPSPEVGMIDHGPGVLAHARGCLALSTALVCHPDPRLIDVRFQSPDLSLTIQGKQFHSIQGKRFHLSGLVRHCR
jgi:hypothetical protein